MLSKHYLSKVSPIGQIIEKKDLRSLAPSTGFVRLYLFIPGLSSRNLLINYDYGLSYINIGFCQIRRYQYQDYALPCIRFFKFPSDIFGIPL